MSDTKSYRKHTGKKKKLKLHLSFEPGKGVDAVPVGLGTSKKEMLQVYDKPMFEFRHLNRCRSLTLHALKRFWKMSLLNTAE